MTEHVAEQQRFLAEELQPKLDASVAGRGHVLFVDAVHFVFATFLCHLWSILRVHVRAASGRQRFNVLGAWDAVTRQLTMVTNTTVVNAETMCELSRAVAAKGLAGPVTMVLDNARYQRNAMVMALAAELKIELLFLPSYSPNLKGDRAAVAVHQAAGVLRQVPRRLRRLPLGRRVGAGRPRNDARRGHGVADDTQLPGVQQCLTAGRVE